MLRLLIRGHKNTNAPGVTGALTIFGFFGSFLVWDRTWIFAWFCFLWGGLYIGFGYCIDDVNIQP